MPPNPDALIDNLSIRHGPGIRTVDSHTAGEPTRLVVDGFGPLAGGTAAEKRVDFMQRCDNLRLRLTREPRGHRGMFAAVLTDTTLTGADFGLIYMDPRRYPFLCGHATIGAVTTVLEGGLIPAREGENRVGVDTPSGLMTAKAQVSGGRVEWVAIRMVPSFVQGTNLPLEIAGLGTIRIDTVCVGGFFAMVSAEQVCLALTAENSGRLVELGMEIIAAANRQLTVSHPARPEVASVDVTEFFEPAGPDRGRSAVIYGESHIDRSPCGTGTAAKLTLLHHRRQLDVTRPFVNRGPLGSEFQARIAAETLVGELPAVEVEIRGAAQVTGLHTFVLDPHDPFPEGYLL